MSGQFAINAAASFPTRVAAAASLYGTFLVTDQANSPSLKAMQTKAEIYIGCAETDRWAPMEMVDQLRTAVAPAGDRIELELHPGVEHGFAFPQRAAYNKDAAERHWERLNALYRRRLG
jgi:carboxymethylenebutenolidase